MTALSNTNSSLVDVFGNRFQKELEAFKKDVAKWQNSPEGVTSPKLGEGVSTDDIPVNKLPPAVTTTTTGSESVHIAPKREDGGEVRERHITTSSTTTAPVN